MSQIADAELYASPCQVFISSEVVAILRNQVLTTQLSSHSYLLDSLHSQQVFCLSHQEKPHDSLCLPFFSKAEAALLSLVLAPRRCVSSKETLNFPH